MSLTTHKKTASKRRLLALFLLSLPLFMLLRWDSSVWLASQVNKVASSSGFDIAYNKVSFTGLGLHFQGLKIAQGTQLSLSLDQLQASLSIDKLFSGELGADVDAVWLSNPLSATLSQEGDTITLSNVKAQIDLLNLFDLQQQLPLRATGMIEIQGDVSLSQTTMMPTLADLSIQWSQAEAGLTTPEFKLGDYLFHIQNGDGEHKPWPWTMTGGTGVSLDGKGFITWLETNLQQSTITGMLNLAVDPSNATLAMMIQAFAGSSKAKIRLFGTISAPRTTIIR